MKNWLRGDSAYYIGLLQTAVVHEFVFRRFRVYLT